MIHINSVVTVKKGAPIKGFYYNGGTFTDVAKRNYRVTVVEVFVEGDRDEIHWQSRHGHYSYTDRKNVIAA